MLDIKVSPGPGPGFTIDYDGGLKKRSVFIIEPTPHGSRLTIIDDYERGPEAERTQRSPEVDKSLNAWGESLRRYFLRYQRWSWLPAWHGYIRRIWIPMKPSTRRIVWLICLITALEFIFFVFVFVIYMIEQNK